MLIPCKSDHIMDGPFPQFKKGLHTLSNLPVCGSKSWTTNCLTIGGTCLYSGPQVLSSAKTTSGLDTWPSFFIFIIRAAYETEFIVCFEGWCLAETNAAK